MMKKMTGEDYIACIIQRKKKGHQRQKELSPGTEIGTIKNLSAKTLYNDKINSRYKTNGYIFFAFIIYFNQLKIFFLRCFFA
jgi:hypothetical protein